MKTRTGRVILSAAVTAAAATTLGPMLARALNGRRTRKD